MFDSALANQNAVSLFWQAVVLFSAALNGLAVGTLVYLGFAASRYFRERPVPFTAEASAADVAGVVAKHVGMGGSITSVAHVGGSKFLVCGHKPPRHSR